MLDLSAGRAGSASIGAISGVGSTPTPAAALRLRGVIFAACRRTGVRRTPCPPKIRRWRLQVSLSVSRLSPSCLTSLSIPFHHLRPVRHYPHLWISARGLGLSGTSTHLTRQLSGTHYGSIRPSPLRWYSRLTVFAACASPLASGDWFLQFRAKACIRFTPPLRRSPSAQSSGT